VDKHPDGKVALVSHGGTIRWLMAEGLLGNDEKEAARLRGIGNGTIVCIDATFDNGNLVIDNVARWDGATVDLDDPND
jgi:broad specificity phosphatase PhoE